VILVHAIGGQAAGPECARERSQPSVQVTYAQGHQLTLTRHFGLTKLTPSLQIGLTKIHCVHLRYSILARHQIAAEPACRFLQPSGD
jgi:hypothetical protein